MSEGRRCKSKHRKFWIICAGHWAWCYECGAIRPATSGTGRVQWAYPVGPDAENPAVTKSSADMRWGKR